MTISPQNDHCSAFSPRVANDHQSQWVQRWFKESRHNSHFSNDAEKKMLASLPPFDDEDEEEMLVRKIEDQK